MAAEVVEKKSKKRKKEVSETVEVEAPSEVAAEAPAKKQKKDKRDKKSKKGDAGEETANVVEKAAEKAAKPTEQESKPVFESKPTVVESKPAVAETKPAVSSKPADHGFTTTNRLSKKPAQNAKPNAKPVVNNKKDENTSKPSALGMYSGEKAGRPWTLSIALPASIVANAQSHELRSYLVAQIARCCTIYGVDEIVVYEDQFELPWKGDTTNTWDSGNDWNSWNDWNTPAKTEEKTDAEKKEKKDADDMSQAMSFFVHNLQYLETPQYLRKILFPMHQDLKFAGLQNPLDAPHHLRKGEKIAYREGVILEERHYPKDRNYGRDGTFVCCGLDEPVWISGWAEIPPNVRVTVKLNEEDRRYGELVSPSTPREESGIYWGYQTRSVKNLQDVFISPPFFGDDVEEKKDQIFGKKSNQNPNLTSNPAVCRIGGLTRYYDLIIGTSERGQDLHTCMFNNTQRKTSKLDFKHALILFGGLGGLEDVMKNQIYRDREFALMKEHNLSSDLPKFFKGNKKEEQGQVEKNPNEKYVCSNPRKLCHHYLNVCPHQASRTIRAEEAVLITLASLDKYLDKK